ncbi:TPA: hypothetical protein DCZ39_03520 [Patescibacteria group bacterium]|nr:hypothetical protein [Candidatus Gracilibacteria bacterium]
MNKSDDATKKFTIPHENAWLRPDHAYFDYKKQATGIDYDEIEWNGKYKTIRELRDLAILGLSFYTMQEYSCFVQMNRLTPSPDAFLARIVSEDTYEIAPIEITFYGRSRIGLPKKSLVEKLSELGGKFQKLPNGYWLLIHIGKDLDVDHRAIRSKLLSLNAKFNAFSIQEISNHPDTISSFVAYTTQLEFYDINVGEICDKLSQTKIPRTLTIKKGRAPAE